MMSQLDRHIATRTCVVCHSKRPKIDLLRVVKTPGGQIELDVIGRMPGRGAYVCKDLNHSGANTKSGGVDRGKLSSALRTNIDDMTVSRLNESIISSSTRQS